MVVVFGVERGVFDGLADTAPFVFVAAVAVVLSSGGGGSVFGGGGVRVDPLFRGRLGLGGPGEGYKGTLDTGTRGGTGGGAFGGGAGVWFGEFALCARETGVGVVGGEVEGGVRVVGVGRGG